MLSVQVLQELDDPQPSLAQLQREFWHHTLPKICGTMQNHLQKARAELASCAVLQQDNYIVQLLDAVKASAELTTKKQLQAVRFLATYKGKATK